MWICKGDAYEITQTCTLAVKTLVVFFTTVHAVINGLFSVVMIWCAALGRGLMRPLVHW